MFRRGISRSLTRSSGFVEAEARAALYAEGWSLLGLGGYRAEATSFSLRTARLCVNALLGRSGCVGNALQ